MKTLFFVLAIITYTTCHQERLGPRNEDDLTLAMNRYADRRSRNSDSWGYGPYGAGLEDMAAVDDLFYPEYYNNGGGYGGNFGSMNRYGGRGSYGNYARDGGYNRKRYRGFYSNLTFGSGWAFGNSGLTNHGNLNNGLQDHWGWANNDY